jgi:hypothetical protein
VKETMNNSNKKLLRVAILLCAATAITAFTCGMIFINSNSVHVDIQYSNALSYSVTDSAVTLTATVTNNGNPVGAGYNVDFYVSADGGTIWANFASQSTDSAGIAQVVYTATTNGGYDFYATATVP